MSKEHDAFLKAFEDLLDKHGAAEAMSLATGVFVGLVVSFAEANGHVSTQEIKVDGGLSRDVTIHPPKQKGAR